MPQEPLLVCKDIYKSFGPTKALQGVSLTVERGQIHGLIGENGSGKSTLTSIIAGIQPADSGEMLIEGKPFSPKTSLDAEAYGVGMIVQEKGTVDMITVAENIFLGREKKFMKGGLFHAGAMNREAKKLLESLGLGAIGPRMNTMWLNAETRKLIEIARVMYVTPDIFIIDETTTTLSQNGRELIYGLMRAQAQQNKAVIFITHDLDELMEMCTDITVLRDGQFVAALKKDETDIRAIRNMMVGREFSDNYYRSDTDGSYSEEVALSMEHVTDSFMIEDFSLELHKGEILGIAGLSEGGMHEIGKIAYGITPTLTGRVVNHLTGTEIRDPATAKQSGIGYISKNRDAESVILNASIKDNILMTSYRKVEKGPFIPNSAEKKFAEKEADKLNLKRRDVNQIVDELSGGNKQKVVFAKWMGNGSDIYIMDCPTRGIDIGVKTSMYQLMYELKKQGKAIMLISEELTEVIGMADRIMVIKDGKVTGQVRREEAPSEHELINYII